MPDNSLKVDRSTVFGNPFVAGKGVDAGRAVEMFSEWIAGDLYYLAQYPCLAAQRHRLVSNMRRLTGKNLGCWCAADQPCHADVLLKLANGGLVKIEA